jgi:hypothetical protein
MMEQEKIISKPVIEFITVANEFCLLIEEIEKYPKENILNYFQKILPLVYLKCSLLPDIDNQDEFFERFVTEEQAQVIAEHIKLKIGPKDDVFKDYINSLSDNNIYKLNISDELSLVYIDLKDFILLYQKNTMIAKANAINFCKLNFEKRLGERIIIVHKAIHSILYHSKMIDNSNEISELE